MNGLIFLVVAQACSSSGKPHGESLWTHDGQDRAEALELTSDESWLEGVSALPAVIAGEERAFSVVTRTDKMPHFPCGQCHMGGERLSVPRKAHWSIALEHADETVMSCKSCHTGDGRFEHLKSLTGTAIAFDRSYQLCGQCHFEQARDWAGGAHGKRMATWAEPRIIQNCTGCHDPHRPAFIQQWPRTSADRPDRENH